MTESIIPVVLCGGSGTRLWPLSRKSFPKQFVPLIEGQSLLHRTLERVSSLSTTVCAVAAEDHRFMVNEAFQANAVSGTILLEPAGRNTTAAMAIAALTLSTGRPDPLLLFCPADHHIPDTAAFARTVLAGRAAAEAGAIVTLGVIPTFPSTAYGYIAQGKPRGDGSHEVDRFIEKPDAETAQALLFQGGFMWNAGIFLVRAGVLLKALQRHAPDILGACRDAMAGARSEQAGAGTTFVRPERGAFEACRAQSIDYAVMEYHDDTAVVPLLAAWSDVGSWNAVARLARQDDYGNGVVGQGLAVSSSNTYLHAPHRPVVALGVNDLVVIDTPDAVLVAHADRVEQVKDVVARLEQLNYPEAATHRKVARPWGWYDSLDVGERFQVKRIGVKPGAVLSLQKHHHRAEHWVVVKGTAEVTRGSEVFLVSENQSTYIPIGEIHRLRNPGMLELEIIEIQSGPYLGEDDIVRVDDEYGRT